MAVRYEEDDATPRRNTFLSVIGDHPTLLVSTVAALIFTIRSVAVTGGDIYTSSILVAHTSLGDAIRALLFFVLPTLLFGISSGLALAAGASIPIFRLTSETYLIGRPLPKLQRPLVLLAASFIVAAVGFSVSGFGVTLSVTYVILAPIVLFILSTLLKFARLGGRSLLGMLVSSALATSVIFLIPLMAAIPLLFVDDTFWLPRERLDFQNEAPFTGYVLKESGDYLVIFKDKPRVIIERKKDSVDDRDFCHLRPTRIEPVSEKVRSNTPLCP
jgi:hypothetical protein